MQNLFFVTIWVAYKKKRYLVLQYGLLYLCCSLVYVIPLDGLRRRVSTLLVGCTSFVLVALAITCCL